MPEPTDDPAAKYILAVTFFKGELWELLALRSPASMLFLILLIPLVCTTLACPLNPPWSQEKGI